MSTQEGSSRLAGSLQALTVRLIGYDFSAQFVNPLSLHWNGVVDETWICEPSVQIGLTESSFAYTNGVHVEASGDELLFRHSGTSVAQGPVLAPQLAGRYVDSFGIGNWIGVSLEFSTRVRERNSAPDTTSPIDSLVWPGLLNRLAINDVRPVVGSTVLYTHPDRTIRIEVVLDSHSDPSGLSCTGQIHRDLAGSPEEALNQLQMILANWESDWKEVLSTAGQLLSAYPDQGGQR